MIGVDEPPTAPPLGMQEGREQEEYDEETGGLPRRTRQHSLAPQLRTVPAPQEEQMEVEPDGGEAGFGDRPAEHNRDLLSSLQAGWTTAREEDDESKNEDESTVLDRRWERGDR
jgi:hypothetical protein